METEAQVFAEEAIRAVSRGDVPAAQMAISQAFDIDRKLGPLADAVQLACSEIEDDGGVSTATWNTLADAVGSPALVALVETSRT